MRAVAVGGDRAQLARLQRAARLVVGLARAPGRHRAPGPGRRTARRWPGPRRRRRARPARRARRRGSRAAARRRSAPDGATSPLTASPRSASVSAASHASGVVRSGGLRTSAVTRPPRPKGSSRRASSAPSSSPAMTADSTSPASRRSVESATRRRSSSSATTVTAWCRISRSISARPSESLAATSHACGSAPAPAAVRGGSPLAIGSASPRGARSGWPGTKPRPSPRRARSRTSSPSAATTSGSSSRRKVAHGLQLAAAVEDERGAADERGQRADDRVEAALGEHDALQALLRGDRALQQRVLLVDQAREGLLGQRDERQLVGHLEEREVALARGLDQRLGHLVVREAGAEAQPGQAVVGEAWRCTRAGLGAVEREPGGEQQLAARQPRRRVARARRCAPSGPACRRSPRPPAGRRRRRPARRGWSAWRHACSILREASSSTGRSTASISSNCSGPAMSGGENWITGSPRSSARQMRPREYISALR